MADAARFDVPDSWGLQDKVAIVTGGGAAGDGIGNGRAAAILLSRAGTRVVVVNTHLVANYGGEWTRENDYARLEHAELTQLAGALEGLDAEQPVVVAGDLNVPSGTWLFDEFAVVGSASMSRLAILYALLLDAAPLTTPARAAAQLGSESWHVNELLPATAIAPFSFAWKRIANGTTVVPRSTQFAEDFIWGRERFLEEARILATLEGAPAVVRVYDFLEANGTAYMIMGLARGDTLEQRLKRDGKLPTNLCKA